MACLITSLPTNGCKEGIGGIAEIAIGNWVDFASGVVIDGTSKVITDLPEATIYRISVLRNLGGYSETVANETNLIFTQTVTVSIFGLAPATRKEVENMCRGAVVVFVRTKTQTKANQWLMCGLAAGMTLTGTFGSGSAAADLNGYALTFTSEEESPAYHLAAYTTEPFDNFADITVSPAYS